MSNYLTEKCSMRKTGRPAENNFTAKDIRKEPQEDAQVKWRHDSQDPHPSICDPQSQRSSSRIEGSQPQIGLLRLGVLHWGDEPLECPALKISGASAWES